MTRKSSTRDNTALFVYDIVSFSRDAIRLAKGRERADLDRDLALRLALVHLIQTIGEAAGKVSDAFKDAHANVPWSRIVGMRHRIVHEYWRVDLDVIWRVVHDDLPPLVEMLAPFARNAGQDPS